MAQALFRAKICFYIDHELACACEHAQAYVHVLLVWASMRLLMYILRA